MVTNNGLRRLESKTQERKILDEVTKVVELEKKRRIYVYELHDNIAETKQKRTVEMRNFEDIVEEQ